MKQHAQYLDAVYNYATSKLVIYSHATSQDKLSEA